MVLYSTILENYQQMLSHNYRPQRSWAKVIFSEACVKNSVHGGGWVWSQGGVSEIFRGGLKFSGGGGLKFSGGVVSEIWGGV